jgi:HAMP domain-containing protein
MFTKIKYKLLFYFLVLGIVPLVIFMVMEYYKNIEALKNRSFEQLKTVRGIKKREIESYFANTREALLLFSQSKVAIDAIKEFKVAFHSVKQSDVPANFKDNLNTYYKSEFKKNVLSPYLDTIQIERLLPHSAPGIFLQAQYLIGNKNLLKPHSYHTIHDRYHKALSDFMSYHGLYDLMLIDNETGHIVYSVDKEIDFGSSLLSDVHNESHLGKLFRAIRYNGISKQTILTDYERYLPSYLAPSSFMATAILDGNKQIGTLVFQIPIDKIDMITTNKKIWREEGLGETGECYIVGQDCRLRTNSRFILESPDSFFSEMKKNKYDSSELTKMKYYKSTILFPITCNKAIAKAQANQSGLEVVKDYRGKEVLNAYSNLNISDVKWTILAEMDTSEAFASIVSYQKRSILISVILIGVLLTSAYFISRSIFKPVQQLMQASLELGNGNLNVYVEIKTQDELRILGEAFNKAVKNLKENQEALLNNNQLLEEQTEEIATQSEKLAKLNTEILQNNSHLDKKVAERTEELRAINKKLMDYAFFNSHKLRGPVATILGLMNLIKISNSTEEKLKCLELMETATDNLDRVIHEIQLILESIQPNDEW